MKTIDLIRGAMHMADKTTGRLADDMRDAPLTRPTVCCASSRPAHRPEAD